MRAFLKAVNSLRWRADTSRCSLALPGCSRAHPRHSRLEPLTAARSLSALLRAIEFSELTGSMFNFKRRDRSLFTATSAAISCGRSAFLPLLTSFIRRQGPSSSAAAGRRRPRAGARYVTNALPWRVRPPPRATSGAARRLGSGEASWLARQVRGFHRRSPACPRP